MNSSLKQFRILLLFTLTDFVPTTMTKRDREREREWRGEDKNITNTTRTNSHQRHTPTERDTKPTLSAIIGAPSSVESSWVSSSFDPSPSNFFPSTKLINCSAIHTTHSNYSRSLALLISLSPSPSPLLSMSLNVVSLGLAPTPLLTSCQQLLSKPDKPDRIQFPNIHNNHTNNYNNNSSESQSRILIQQQQQQQVQSPPVQPQQQPLSPSNSPSPSPSSTSSSGRVSLVLRPRHKTIESSSPLISSLSSASSPPSTGDSLTGGSIRVSPSPSLVGESSSVGLVSARASISIPIHRRASQGARRESITTGNELSQSVPNGVMEGTLYKQLQQQNSHHQPLNQQLHSPSSSLSPSPLHTPSHSALPHGRRQSTTSGSSGSLLSPARDEKQNHLSSPVSTPPNNHPSDPLLPPSRIGSSSASSFSSSSPSPPLERSVKCSVEIEESTAQILILSDSGGASEIITTSTVSHVTHDTSSRTTTPSTSSAAPFGRSSSIISPTQALMPTPPSTTPSRQIFSAANASLVLQGTDEGTLCGLCEKHVAELHCSECALNLCVAGGCNRTLHSTRQMRTHTRVPIIAGVPDIDHATRPSTAASNPGSATRRASQESMFPFGPPTFSRRSTGRSSLIAPLQPNIMAQMATPNGRRSSDALSPNSTPLPPPSLTDDSTKSKDEPSADSASDDDTDALLVAKESQAIDGPRCDQCHLAPASVYCIDCASSLCDSSSALTNSGCNRKIHKAHKMARHRQVRIEERDEIIEQIEQEEDNAQARQQQPSSISPALSPSQAAQLPSAHSLPRASFIAPLTSRRSGPFTAIGGVGYSNYSPSHRLSSPSHSLASPSNSLELTPSNGRSSRSSRTNSLLTPTPPNGRPPLTPTSLVPRPPSSSSAASNTNSPMHQLQAAAMATPRNRRHSATMNNAALANASTCADDEPEFDPAFTSPLPSTRLHSSFQSSSPTPVAPHRSPNSLDPSVGPSPTSHSLPSLPPPAMPASTSIEHPCDNCDSPTSGAYCVECAMYLCVNRSCASEQSCSQMIHLPKKMKTHQSQLRDGAHSCGIH